MPQELDSAIIDLRCSSSRSVLYQRDGTEKYAEALREFLTRMGQAASQGAVGLVIDRDYLEIRFPVAEE